MAISLLDQLSIKKKAQNVARDSFPNIEAAVAYNPNWLPSVFHAMLEDTGEIIIYNESNADMGDGWGKWRRFSGGSADLMNYFNKQETTALLENYVAKETGKVLSSNDYTTLEKEKLASLENYDDTNVQTHIVNSEQAITDIQTVIGAEILNTTAQTLSGAINEVKANGESATSAVTERVAKNEQAITVLNGDETISGSVKESTATTLAEAKAYTDQQILAMDYDAALVVDEKPVFNEDDWTVTYVKDGVTETTEGTQIWFYYMEDGKLMQTIWLGGNEVTVVSAGAINFADYVSKTLDVVSTYNGAETDTAKVPNLSAMKALQTLLQTNIDDKISGDAILDVLDSSSENSALSANQGRVLNEKINTKLDKIFTGDDVASKPLVTDSMGNVVLGKFDETIESTSSNAPQSRAVKTELDKKLSIEQGVDNANKVLSVGDDGNIRLAEPSTLGGSAKLVSWTNDTYPDLTDVDKALRNLFAKVYYEAIAITSFTCSANSEYEIGTVLPANSITFTWGYNKDATGQTLTDCTIELADREAVYGADLNSTKTFTLNCSDGTTSRSSSKKISFLPKIYYGSTTEPENGEYNSAFALGLSNSVLTSSSKRDYSFNCGSGEYAYIICPTNQNFKGEIWVNGFQATMQKQATISLTNESNYTQSYDIWRFTNSGLGSFVGTVK